MARTKEQMRDYMREYRATTKPMAEREAKTQGMREGIERCVRWLRDRGQHDNASRMERANLESEPFEIEARRQFIDALRGGQGAANGK